MRLFALVPGLFHCFQIADNDICVDMERYQGFREGFASGTIEFVLIPMRKEERWEYYRRNLSMFQSITAVFAVLDYYAMDLYYFLIKPLNYLSSNML